MKKTEKIAARLTPTTASKLAELMEKEAENGSPATITETLEAALAVLHLLRVDGLRHGVEDRQGNAIKAWPLSTLPHVIDALGAGGGNE